MKRFLTRVRRRLDAMPLWSVAAINAGVLALWLADFRIPDPLPYMDELFVTAVLAGTSLYLWNRWFGPPSALSAETRRRRAEIEQLFEDTRAISGATRVSAELARLEELVRRVATIQERIEQTEIVLQDPTYAPGTADAEIARLGKALAASTGGARENLAGALEEARRHRSNIQSIAARRDELVAALERIHQIFRRIHSQVVSVGLSEGNEAAVGESVEELARTLEEYESERRRLEEAEQIVDRELAETERRSRSKANLN